MALFYRCVSFSILLSCSEGRYRGHQWRLFILLIRTAVVASERAAHHPVAIPLVATPGSPARASSGRRRRAAGAAAEKAPSAGEQTPEAPFGTTQPTVRIVLGECLPWMLVVSGCDPIGTIMRSAREPCTRQLRRPRSRGASQTECGASVPELNLAQHDEFRSVHVVNITHHRRTARQMPRACSGVRSRRDSRSSLATNSSATDGATDEDGCCWPSAPPAAASRTGPAPTSRRARPSPRRRGRACPRPPPPRTQLFQPCGRPALPTGRALAPVLRVPVKGTPRRGANACPRGVAPVDGRPASRE